MFKLLALGLGFSYCTKTLCITPEALKWGSGPEQYAYTAQLVKNDTCLIAAFPMWIVSVSIKMHLEIQIHLQIL